jgi:hypothetical protein
MPRDEPMRRPVPPLLIVLCLVLSAAACLVALTRPAPRVINARAAVVACATHRDGGGKCLRTRRTAHRRHSLTDPSLPFRFFSPTSFWNTPLAAAAPLDPSSPSLISDLTGYVSREQASRTGPWIDATSNGVTIVTVPANQPAVPVRLNHAPDANLSSAWSAVPLPASARPSPGDNDLAVWQPSTDTMWEFFQLHHDATGWQAEWGGAMRNVSANPGVYAPGAWPATWTGDETYWGVTAASLPIVGGAMTYDDLRAGQINHALALVYPNVRRRTFVSPAQRDDGSSTDPNSLPEGARLRLDPSLDLAALNLPPLTRMIARAAQRYGVVIRDQSPVIAFVQQDPTGNQAFLALGPSLTQGLYASQLLASFPWGHLQVMKMDVHQGW